MSPENRAFRPQVVESAIVDAPAALVHRILSDYVVEHPRILPRRAFESVVVEEGGRGEGTVVRVTMRVFGAKRTFRMHVTEPEPGRVLREEDANAGVVTQFTLTPEPGLRARVEIATEWRRRPGFGAALERWTAALFARAVYRRQLHLLADRLVFDDPAATRAA